MIANVIGPKWLQVIVTTLLEQKDCQSKPRLRSAWIIGTLVKQAKYVVRSALDWKAQCSISILDYLQIYLSIIIN